MVCPPTWAGTDKAGGLPPFTATVACTVLFPAAALIRAFRFCATTPPMTWKLVVDCPEIALTVGGMFSAVPLLPLSTMENAPEAGLLSVTVHDAVSPGLSRFGAHARPVNELPVLIFNVPEIGNPDTTAVIVAVLPVVVEPTVATNVMLDEPAGMVIAAGTETTGLFTEIVAVVGELTGVDRDSVHVDVPGAATLAGLHVRDVVPLDVLRVTCVVAVVPLPVALICAVAFAEIAPAVTLNVALVCPAGMTRSTGTGSSVESEASATAIGVELLALKVTVHVALLLLVRVEGTQLTLVTLMAGARNTTVVCDCPPSVAVTVA